MDEFFAGFEAPALELDEAAFWYPLAYEIDGEFCYFHLVLRWYDNENESSMETPLSPEGNVLNAFKPATNGKPFLVAGTTIGFLGLTSTNRHTSVPTQGGRPIMTWVSMASMSLDVLVRDADECALDIYDGDMDYCGNNPDPEGTCWPPDFEEETDDPNTPPDAVRFVPGEPRPPRGGYPFPVSGLLKPEGVSPGGPRDDNPQDSEISIEPAVYYTVRGPVSENPEDGEYNVTNLNPPGNQEMELFRIASNRTEKCPDPTMSPYDPDGEYD